MKVLEIIGYASVIMLISTVLAIAGNWYVNWGLKQYKAQPKVEVYKGKKKLTA